jgi:hypothetical protein
MIMQNDQKAFLVLGALAGVAALTTLTAATEYAAGALSSQRALGEPLLKVETTDRPHGAATHETGQGKYLTARPFWRPMLFGCFTNF